MDKDDKKYIKQGHTLISLTEDVPTTRDKEVLSKEELDNEREEEGWVTKRSIFSEGRTALTRESPSRKLHT